MEKYIGIINEEYEIELSRDCVFSCYHSGSCEYDVSIWVKDPVVANELSKIPLDSLQEHIISTGACDLSDITCWPRTKLEEFVLWDICALIQGN